MLMDIYFYMTQAKNAHHQGNVLKFYSGYIYTLAASYSWKQLSRTNWPHTASSVDTSSVVFNQTAKE